MPAARPREGGGRSRATGTNAPLAVGLVVIVTIQIVCTLFFVWEIGASLFGVAREPLSWQVREMLEIGAALGLLIGVGFGAILLARTVRRNRDVENQLRQLSGAFAELLEERFGQWSLTPSEREVAWLTVKGLSIADIARIRQTSEGTVKAQSNAIYRKAGVSSRTQLLSLFIEDLLDGDIGPSEPPTA
jgi:DNA-binding CsgD family transcriptional regulator